MVLTVGSVLIFVSAYQLSNPSGTGCVNNCRRLEEADARRCRLLVAIVDGVAELEPRWS